MADSCCICGLILGFIDSTLPQWYKDIHALCWFEDRPILSGRGYVDDDALSYNLPIPSNDPNRFSYRYNLFDELDDSCYPFHTACLSLFLEFNTGKLFDRDIEKLFRIFESIHYDKNTAILNWGHGFYFEDILERSFDLEGEVVDERLPIFADPLVFNLEQMLSFSSYRQTSMVSSYRQSGMVSIVISSMIESVPPEIFLAIILFLDFCDTQHLLHASSTLYRQYGRDRYDLPEIFWESMFWPYSETGFARSLCPASYTWREWFFTIKLELRNGPNRMVLRNRKRIWKLAADLTSLLYTAGCSLQGDVVTSVPTQTNAYVASCLAQVYDSAGCRELEQRSVSLDKASRLRAVVLSYVSLSKRILTSGLSFEFENGESADIGYVDSKGRHRTEAPIASQFLWLVATQLGFAMITVDSDLLWCVDKFDGTSLAIARWSLESLEGVSLVLGLDAFRIVSVSITNQKPKKMDGILWRHPYPSSIPLIHEDDVAALYKLQRISFAPASYCYIKPEENDLVTIKIYSQLGLHAGIAGIGFVSEIGAEHIWGSAYDTASLAFFMAKRERLVSIIVYKIGSMVCHLKFVTSFRRTSGILPQPSMIYGESLECVEYKSLNEGHIIGFCGCFEASSDQLNCFGIISQSAATCSILTPFRNTLKMPSETQSQLLLGGVKGHGQHRSAIALWKKYQSVQVSINPMRSKYRRAGQVTGLIFRSYENHSNPDLLGQWTGAGAIHNFEEGEKVIDLVFTKTEPLSVQGIRPWLSQVDSIIMVTNKRRFDWGPGRVEVDRQEKHIAEVVWEFNAIFDQVTCTY